MKKITLLFALISLVPIGKLFAHCQVPCGIFEDEVVFNQLLTDIETIEKAMVQIEIGNKEHADSTKPTQQVIRWVMNKESHAQNIQTVMADYFLAQRIKRALAKENPERYTELLEKCHMVIVHAMKTKQTTQLAAVKTLKSSLADFKNLYFEGAQHSH